MLDRPPSTRAAETFQETHPPVVVWYTGHFYCYLLPNRLDDQQKGFPEIVGRVYTMWVSPWSSLLHLDDKLIQMLQNASLWPSGRDMSHYHWLLCLLRHVLSLWSKMPCLVESRSLIHIITTLHRRLHSNHWSSIAFRGTGFIDKPSVSF